MAAETSPALAALEEKLQSLRDLHNRLQAIRVGQVFPSLLRPPPTIGLQVPSFHEPLERKVETLKEVGEFVKSEKVQEALKAAGESEKADKSELTMSWRRENRKRRRAPSPESPQPYHSFQPKSTFLFPVLEHETTPLKVDDLASYIRDFNRTPEHTHCKLHIWTPTGNKIQKIGNPAIVRFTIRDVLTAYVTAAHDPDTRVLAVETVTAFGPREKKSPHSQSEYVAYQKLSQHIARMLQSHPTVCFQTVMGLLVSYEGLFTQQCASCERVLSAEGHVPPVARLWIESALGSEAGKGGTNWQPRHVTCLQS
ncbi:hypothetical protein OE88DRAFT_1624438 [Heliocybe sulcata]|uniref:Uncharacterized protein n=1 Tax=Heliocybe sulcata TaxID=5364 RepID=A0A5C3N887_9AGAM|nr:hypothetical protein OE88DRAFT_1624438 [Heliocybe sulcata]